MPETTADDRPTEGRTGPYRGTATLYDLVYRLQGKDYTAEVDELVRQVRGRCAGASSLLDVGCGTGHHLELLSAHFRELAGVDLSPEMLEVARGRLGEVELQVADMREFSLGRSFDVVVSLFSAVGYMADAHELTLAVGAMVSHLAPGGVLVVDGWVRPELWRGGGDVRVESGAEGDEALARFTRRHSDGRHTWLEMTYVHSTPAGVTTDVEEHRLTLFTDDEYRSAFVAAGLDVEVVPSPMEGRDRYVAVRH